MKFNRISAWAEVSEDGRYTVSAHKVAGKYGFQAWRKPPAGSKDIAALLGTKDDAEAARELCRADAQARAA